MGNDTPKLTDDQVLEHATQSLEAHLPVVAGRGLQVHNGRPAAYPVDSSGATVHDRSCVR